jgi:hypothetical protein
MFDYGIGWNSSRGSSRFDDLGAVEDDFEAASSDGDGQRMDEILDALSRQVERDGSRHDRRLSRTERGLDRLGAMARSFGSDGSEEYQQDDDTIQRLRSALLAAMNGGDGLNTALGDMPLDELIERAQQLSDRLRDRGFDRQADHVDRAIRTLERMRDREERSGRPLQNDERLSEPSPGSHCSRPMPGGWNDPRGMERDGDRIVTRGGYEIAPEGDGNWSIFDPNGDMLARIEGDPHVTEGDGSRWDFSRDSVFRLPDGTQIFADTDQGAGRGQEAITRRLVLDDGQDRATIDGIGGSDPEIGEIGASERSDFESAHGDEAEGHDVFSLVSEGDRIAFELLRSLGIIDGSSLGDDGYEPTTAPA